MANRDNASKYMLQKSSSCNAEMHFFPFSFCTWKDEPPLTGIQGQKPHSRDSSSATCDCFLQWQEIPSAKYLLGVVEWKRLPKRGRGCPWPFHTVNRDRQHAVSSILCEFCSGKVPLVPWEGIRYCCLYLPTGVSPCSISQVESDFPKIILMNSMCIWWLNKAL